MKANPNDRSPAVLLSPERATTVAIAGGGLAGLALSIQLAKRGYAVVLFEKESYPFHRVCGEYISMESWNFLLSLGVDLHGLNPPIIRELELTSQTGQSLRQKLPLGGFGISRYELDGLLANIARSLGVEILEDCKVTDIQYENDSFIIQTTQQSYRATVACGSFGKRSQLDIKWKRPFITNTKNRLNNFIGIKYHIKGNFNADTISLHLFRNGYCGLVKITGEDQYNLCYLSTAANLKACEGSIPGMEKRILSQNPRLKEIFSGMETVPGSQVTISQISFDKKSQVEDHVLMIGDAAGMISPLCGNGMSMALHGSKIAADCILSFLNKAINRDTMEQRYQREWQQQFSRRLRTGRIIQRLFGHQRLSNFVLFLGKLFPGLLTRLIRQTHGRPF